MAGTALIAEELTTNQSLYIVVSVAISLLSSPSTWLHLAAGQLSPAKELHLSR